MIPCRKDKCLKFPVCKTQRTIFCSLLYNYMYSTINKQDEAFSILVHLIECYRDRGDLQRRYMADIKDSSPIINSYRLIGEYEEKNL